MFPENSFKIENSSFKGREKKFLREAAFGECSILMGDRNRNN